SIRSFSVQAVSRNAVESTYKAPALGVNKTYDEALKIIAEDKLKRLNEVKNLKESLAQLMKDTPSDTRDSKIAQLKENIFKQEAYAEINDPEIQWRFKNGHIDMSKAVFRYLKSKQFQRETLPVIQQRITQMFVTPDLLPPFTPSLNVQLDFSGSASKEESGAPTNYFETGSYLLPRNTIKEPRVNVTSFHSEQKYYTIAMVDPDVPDVENQSFKQQLHWLISNVSLSATQPDLVKENADVLLPYLPPHPPMGTKYHRYTLLVAEQPNGGQEKIQIEKDQISRETTLQELCSQYNLSVKGLTFFRQVWDKDVSRIYKDILQQSEPVYGKLPKVDELLDETGQKKKKFIHLAHIQESRPRRLIVHKQNIHVNTLLMTHNDSALTTSNNTVISLHDDPSSLKEKDPVVLTNFQKICLKFEPLMLYVVSMAQFLDIVNGASMTVAMLPISRELNFEVQQQQWLISSYALSFGGLLLIAGRMGDLFGHRRVFLSGLFWFGIWSLVNGFSKSPVMLCISRAFQGMGAAAQIPTALALIAIKYPAGKARTRALSVFGAIGAMGAVTGLLLSGALTSTIGWQWIFFLSAIMSSILFVLGVFAIPSASGLHGDSPRIDVGGAFTVTGALGFILLACSAILFSFVTPTSTYWVLPFLAMIVNVFGLGLIMLPAQITALRDASDDDQGVVGAIYNVGLQIGAPFGLAILTVISGKLNGENPGPDRMHGYKYSLIGDAAFAILGFLLTLIFLPHVKPGVSPKVSSLEEGGVPGSEMDSVTEIEVVSADQGLPQKQGLNEITQKQEFNEIPQKQELKDAKEELLEEVHAKTDLSLK
ncbi:hypothetical protein BGZ80_009039, partial [Entomortierella chlamydospora]